MSLGRKRIEVRPGTIFAACVIFWSGALFSSAWAAGIPVVEGSELTHRTAVDGDDGQVYIYTGGSFPAGTHLLAFKYLFDFTGPEGNTFGYITPLLFAREFRPPSSVIYTVVGIGRTFTVNLNSAVGTIPFDVVNGIKVPTNGTFTFGYVNALVNPNGAQIISSAGTIDMDQFLQGGDGLGGAGTTNNWAVTALGPPFPSVALGTTFGAGADYGFFSSSRTYSATAVGILPSSN